MIDDSSKLVDYLYTAFGGIEILSEAPFSVKSSGVIYRFSKDFSILYVNDFAYGTEDSGMLSALVTAVTHIALESRRKGIYDPALSKALFRLKEIEKTESFYKEEE